MLKIISPSHRKYRVKRKALKLGKKKFSSIALTLKVIAIFSFICSVPFLVMALPLVLIAITFLYFADTCNRVGETFDN